METPVAKDDKSHSTTETKIASPPPSGRPEIGTPKTKMVPLIGKRIEIGCTLGGLQVRAIWDTGSQVSLVSRSWLTQHLPESCIKPVSDLTDQCLSLTGANNGPIPYSGYTPLSLKLGSLASNLIVTVPFMVNLGEMSVPLIGSNVIEHLMEGETWQKKLENITKLEMNEEDTQVLSTQIENMIESKLSIVNTQKNKKSVIPARSTVEIKCRLNTIISEDNQRVLFEPREDWQMENGNLQLNHSVIELKKGINSHIRVFISNSSDETIELDPELYLGTIEEAELSDTSIIYEPAKIRKINVSQVDAPPVVTKSFEELTDEEAENHKLLHTFLKENHFPRLHPEESKALKQMLWNERNVFSRHEDDIGNVPDLELHISTLDKEPVVKNYNSIPKPLMVEVKEHVENMLSRGWIQKSKSSWSSPVVIAKKKDGRIRLCVDYRLLNKKTIADKFPIPRIQEALDQLQGSSLFSCLDMAKAYHQGYVAQSSRDRTAFVTPWGFYEWLRIPFGLKNAVSTFQRYMEGVLEAERCHYAIPYLDDTIIHSIDAQSHINHLRQVLQRFKSRGLKLNIAKCDLCKSEVSYLGRIVSKDGYKMDPRNIQAVQELKNKNFQTIGEVRQVLGLLSFHRRFVQNFASIAKPLSDLLVIDEFDTKAKDLKGAIPSNWKIKWEENHQKALEELIDIVTHPPILAFADFSKEFFVHVDASGKGLGAILYQEVDGQNKTIAYASRSLKPSEKNYHSSKLEFLALKWAVCEQFQTYLAYTQHFKIFTDNNPLLYIMGLEKPNATTQCWVSQLSDFNFTIHYRAEKINKDADCLSRMPLDINKYTDLCKERTSLNSFEAMVGEVHAAPIYLNPETEIKLAKIDLLARDSPTIDMKWDQDQDEYIQPIKRMIEGNGKIEPELKLTERSKVLIRNKQKLFLDDDSILWRKSSNGDQIVLPLKHRATIYKTLHTDLGHLGSERVLQLAQQRVWWPSMAKDIEEFTRERCRCLRQRSTRCKPVAPLVSIHSNGPMDLVCIDFLHLEKASNGCEYILLVVDHFTRYAQAYPTRNKSSVTAARILFNEYIPRFGIPARILSDQGKEFDNSLFQHLGKFCGLTRSRTSPYHPQTNGTCERMNSTLLQMLRTLPESDKNKWPDKLNQLIFAYNCTNHSTTRCSPYFLLFGREPLLPLDFFLCGTSKRTLKARRYRDFVEEWEKRMSEAYSLVQERCKAAKERSEARWKKRLIATQLKVGDKVLVSNKREQGGPGKIRARWEADVFEVIEVLGEGVVYKVANLSKAKDERVLHRNLLLPCELIEEEHPVQSKKTSVEKDTREKPFTKTARTSSQPESSSSDEDLDAVQELPWPIRSHNNLERPAQNSVTQTEDTIELVQLENINEQMVSNEQQTQPIDQQAESVEQEIEQEALEEAEGENVEQEPAVQNETRRSSLRNRHPTTQFQYYKLGGFNVTAESNSNGDNRRGIVGWIRKKLSRNRNNQTINN